MGIRMAPFVVLLVLNPTLNALVTAKETFEDETILVRERRFTNGEGQWTHSITEKSSSTTALSPSNVLEKYTKPIVLQPLKLTLVHKSFFTLKPEKGISSRQERNLVGSSYSCLSCSSDDNNLFETSISRTGQLFSRSSDSATSSLEHSLVKEMTGKVSSEPFPITWKSLLYKPRKSVVRGFLASPGKSIKEITELPLISKYNDESHSKNALDSAEEEPKKISSRPKFTIVPAVVRHIPLSFTETNEIFHNLFLKFVKKKNTPELKRDSLSYENNEIRRIGVPLNNFTPNTFHSPVISPDNLQSSMFRQYRQIPRRSQIIPATLVFKHFSSSHQRR